jgi:gliding motility-associated-like protein
MFTRVKHSVFFTLALFPAVLSSQKPADASVTVLENGQKRYVITAQKKEQIVEITQLQVGEAYALVVPPDYAAGSCLPDMSVIEPTAIHLSYSADSHSLRFKATSSTARIRFIYPCEWPGNSPPRHYVSLGCLTCPLKASATNLVEFTTLDVENAGLEELIKDIFIGGDCFDVTNITMAGGGNQVGKFFNGATNIGFNSGIMLATGDIGVAIGPNDQDGAGGGGNGSSDINLVNIATGPMFDVSTIEFDFTPTQSLLSFDYVFASEEYCEYVNTQFNDVFGFFISGPGINGVKNLATIGNSAPITINTINHITNSALYVHNTPPGEDRNNCQDGGIMGGLPPATPSLSQATQECEFDGFTRRMTATVQVVPCATYHIKLAIADVGDGLFDSAVFLRAGSFAGGGNASIKWLVNDDPNVSEVTEGCGDVKILVDRLGANFASPLTVSYTITGTATSGADFSPIPGSITIPAGEEQVLFPVNIMSDLLQDGAETIILTLNNRCSCLHPQEVLTILDHKPMKLEPDTIYVCGPGAQGTVAVQVEGGQLPYSYKWSTGGTEETLSVTTNASNTYTVTVTDACGKTAVAYSRINVTAAPVAKFLPSAPQLCPGKTAELQVAFSGNGPFQLQYTLNDDHQTPIAGANGNPYLFLVNLPGVYTLTGVVDSFGCVGTATGSVNVVPSDLVINAVSSNPACPLSTDGTISVTATGGSIPYRYDWTGNTPIGNMPNPMNLLPGQYSVTVTDFWGCTQTQNLALVAPNAITPSAVVQGVTCSEPLAGSIDVSVTGGVPAFKYNWSNGSTAQDINNLAAGSYLVTISDDGGCSTVYTVVVPSNTTLPVANAVPVGTLTCDLNAISLDATGSSTGPEYTYTWTATPGHIVSGGNTLAPVIDEGGNYTLQITNTVNGCKASVTVPVVPDVTPPVINAVTDATITCSVDTVILRGSVLPQGMDFDWKWTATGGGLIAGSDTMDSLATATPGVYILEITNRANGCTATDSALVTLNTTPPSVAAEGGEITCTASVLLIKSVTDNNMNVDCSWTAGPGAHIVIGAKTCTPVVDAPGSYTVTVTDNSNGCTNTAVAVVTTDVAPPVAEAVVEDKITCQRSSVKVTATGDPGYMYQWQLPGGQMAGGISLQATVPGTYKLTVTNPVNHCTASATVLVSADLTAPAADAGIQQTLTCTQESLELNGTGSGAPGLTYLWTTTDGSILSPVNISNPTVNAPGVYTLVVTNPANGCSASDMVTVLPDNERPEVKISTPGELNCVTTQMMLSSAGTSSGATFSYSWSGPGLISAPETPDATVNQPGQYTLQVTNINNGCTTAMSVNVPQNITAPTAEAGPNNSLSCKQPEVQIGDPGNTPTPNHTYKWSGPVLIQGGPTTWVNQPGTYILTVTDIQNGCTSADSVIIGQDTALPQADAGQGAVLSCRMPEFTLQGTGSTGQRYQYKWFGSVSAPIPSDVLNPKASLPGVYTLMVTDTVNGCIATSSVTVIESFNNPAASVASVLPLTCDSTERILNATGSSTGVNYTYQWTSPDGGHIVSGINTLMPKVDEPGTYTLLVTDQNNGCTQTAYVLVSEEVIPPYANAGADRVLTCKTPEIPLGDPGNPSNSNYKTEWSGPVFEVSGNVWASQPGSYVVTVTDTYNGCTSTDEVIVTQDIATPYANAGAGVVLTCHLPVFELQGSGSTGTRYEYKWLGPGNAPELPEVLNPLVSVPGFYTLMVTDTVNGCVATSSVTVTQLPNTLTAAIAPVPPLTCERTTLVLDATGSSKDASYTYQWTLPDGSHIDVTENTLDLLIDKPGTYMLKVTDPESGCTNEANIAVTEEKEYPVADAGENKTITCSAQQIALSGSVQSAQNNWVVSWEAVGSGSFTGNMDTLTPTVNAGGIYKMTVKNLENGCASSDTVSVNVDYLHPDANVDSDTLTCANSTVKLNPDGSSTGNVSYAWTTTDGHFIEPINPVMPVVDQPGAYTLLVTYLSNGCTASATVTVPQDTLHPVVSAGADGVLDCNVTDIVLNGSTTGQHPVYQYEWITANGSFTSHVLNPTVNAPGTYRLVVTNSSNGCVASDEVIVGTNRQIPSVEIDSPDIITCRQPLVTLKGNISLAGPDITYNWTTTDGLIDSVSGNSCRVSRPGTYTLEVINTSNGCAGQDYVKVNESIRIPEADAGTPRELDCSGDPVSLDGTLTPLDQNYLYQWTTVAGNIVSGENTLKPEVDEPGVYTLLVTNRITGCNNSDTVSVHIDIPTDIVFDLKRPGCKGNDGVIRFLEVRGGTDPYLYSIDGGDTFIAVDTFYGITPGSYSLYIQDSKGCEYQENIVIPQLPAPELALSSSLELVLGDSIELNATLPFGYPVSLIDTVIWTPVEGLSFRSNSIQDMLRPMARPFSSTEYTVTVISKDGCDDRDNVLIRVDNEARIYVPNVFSPWDQDGDNDVFLIFADDKQILQVDQFQIYDRWGEMVFSASNFQPNDPSYGWDGSHGGKTMLPGVYVYYIEIRLIDGRKLLLKGDVTIVR